MEEGDAPIKRCPKCRVYIERDEGCAQMMCKNCKHAFCWYCLESLDVSTAPPHMAAMSPESRYVGEEAGDACSREAGGHAGHREVASGDDSSVFMVPRGEAWSLVLGIEA